MQRYEMLTPARPEQPQDTVLFRSRNYHPETLGHSLAGMLEGRVRPLSVVQQPLEAILVSSSTLPARTKLTEEGFSTVVDLLYFTPDRLKSFVGETGAKRVEGALAGYFESLTITPAQRVLKAVFGEEQLPISPIREEELDQTFSAMLKSSLTEQQQTVMEERYGLKTWQPKTPKQVSATLRLPTKRVIQVEAQVLRQLRHWKPKGALMKFMSLPADSVARKIAQLPLTRGDLSILEGIPLTELGDVAEWVQKAGEKFALMWPNVGALANVDAEVFLESLSPEQVEGLGVAVREVYEKAKAGTYRKPQEAAVFPAVQPEEEVTLYPNRLIPDVEIPWEILAAIGKVHIRDLDLSVREFIALSRAIGFEKQRRLGMGRREVTIADVLELSPEELLAISNLGRKSSESIITKLREYIARAVSASDASLTETRAGVLLNTVLKLPEIPAGKHQLKDWEKLQGSSFGANFIITRNRVHLPDETEFSFIAVSVSGEVESREKMVQFLVSVFGQPTEYIVSQDPNDPDCLTFPTPASNPQVQL